MQGPQVDADRDRARSRSAGEGQALIKITVDGSAIPYSERASFHRGKDGKLKVWSFRPDRVDNYQVVLGWSARQAMTGRPLLTGPIKLSITAFMPIPKSGLRKADRADAERELLYHTKRPDLTNLLKAIEDAFKKVVWVDDSLVCKMELSKVYSPRPRLEIEVEPLAHRAEVNHAVLQAATAAARA